MGHIRLGKLRRNRRWKEVMINEDSRSMDRPSRITFTMSVRFHCSGSVKF